MNNLAKKALFPIAGGLLSLYGKLYSNRYSIDHTIAVAGSSRGGSTWLAEIIASLPGRPMIWEPLHPGNNPKCREYGFGWQNYVREGSSSPLREEYLKQLLIGRDLSTRTLTFPQLRFSQFWGISGYLVKFVNANMLLPWLTNIFSIRTILIVRHPCAVVSSQLRHGGWSSLSKENITVPPDLFDDYPHLNRIFERITTLEELLAFEWAIQTLVPLSSPNRRWEITSYERLVTSGEEELKRLFKYLGEKMPEGLLERYDRNSATTASDSNLVSGKNPLTGWTENLSKKQIEKILSVAHQAGLLFYTENLEPDYSKFEYRKP